MQLFARLFEVTGGTFSVDLHDVLANDEHTAALYTIRGERAGKQRLTDNQVQIFPHPRRQSVRGVGSGH
jgi:hypothetical protein